MAGAAKLVDGPIGPALMRLAVPMSIGIIAIMLVNVVDTYFVGMLGTEELTAISFSFPVVTLVMSVALGLGIGTTSAISRAIGAGDERAVRRLTAHALLLAFLVVALVSLIGVATIEPVFSRLGASPRSIELIRPYMVLWYSGAAFLVVPMVANGVLRASGDANTPMVLMIVAAIMNGILDPILIFGVGEMPGRGLAGAAEATLVARIVVFACTFYVLARRKILDLHLPSVAELMASWKAVVSVGAPAAITNALTPVATAIMTALVAREGQDAVAAYGVGSRLEGLLMIAPFGLTAALTPFIGQNWGAHRYERVARGLSLSKRFVLAWGAGAWLLLLGGGGPLARAFADDPAIVAKVEEFLWIIPLSYGFSGVASVASAAFNAVDRALRSTLLSATRSLLLAVPLAYVGAEYAGLRGLFIGLATATVLSGIIASIWMRGLTHPVRHDADAEGVSARAKTARESARAVLEGLLERARAVDGLHVRRRPIRTIGFYCRGRELGHVHRDGHVDLHLPPSIGQALVLRGHADHHRHLPTDNSWLTHRLQDTGDVDAVVQMLELGVALHGVCCESGTDAAGNARLETLAGALGIGPEAAAFVARSRPDAPASASAALSSS